MRSIGQLDRRGSGKWDDEEVDDKTAKKRARVHSSKEASSPDSVVATKVVSVDGGETIL